MFAKLWTREAALIAFATVLITFIVVEAIPKAGFESSELAFADGSKKGFGILPASCPSDPHLSGNCTCNTSVTALSLNADNESYRLNALQVKRRISRFNAYFCVENSTGSAYYIPAKTQAELDAFRAAAPNINGVDVWGYAAYSQATYYSQAGYYGQSSYGYAEGYYGK